jgi:hypothetical protein
MLLSTTAPSFGPADPRCTNATTTADFLATGSVNLLRYGGAGDSVADDAATLRSAIGCHNRVFIPAPSWPTTPGGRPGPIPPPRMPSPSFKPFQCTRSSAHVQGF